MPSDLPPERRGRRWRQQQFDPVVRLDTMVFGCIGGNDGNARAAMKTTPSTAASVSSVDRNNNQQATGVSERGEYEKTTMTATGDDGRCGKDERDT